MVKASNLIGLVALVAVSFAAGLVVTNLKDRSRTNSLIESFAPRYPAVDFSSCRQMPLDQTPNCLDARLAAYAVTNQSIESCEGIQSQASRVQCLDRVRFIERLGADAKAFCQELSSDPLCIDLANVLAAQINNKRELCLSITNEGLRSVCFDLVSAPGATPPPAPTEVVNQDELPLRQYGLVCSASDAACQSSLSTFRAAILAKSEEQCQSLGFYANLCLTELSLYRAYTANDIKLCTARNPEPLCNLWLTTARALDGKPALCESLADATLKESCSIEVKSAQGQTRFGYLTK